jgi:hypothetical protein
LQYSKKYAGTEMFLTEKGFAKKAGPILAAAYGTSTQAPKKAHSAHKKRAGPVAAARRA